jgi:hypothetical protein
MACETYTKKWRAFCYLLTLSICAALGVRSLYFLLLAPAVLFVVSVVASIISKQMFPPPIEAVVDRSNEARYTPL